MSTREVILTGDTPTGQLHLGHYVGSVKRRVELQDTHDCFFLLANLHAYTTRADQPNEIHADTLEIVRDYLAMGIDPEKAVITLQSEVPAICELTFLFAMGKKAASKDQLGFGELTMLPDTLRQSLQGWKL